MHIELNVPDPKGVAEFFHNLFGWEFPVQNESMFYGQNGDLVLGIVSYTDSKFFPGTTSFFPVSSLSEFTTKAEQLGATIILKEENLPNELGKIAILLIPDGKIPIGFWEKG